VAAASAEAHTTRQQVADRFGVSYSFVTKLLAHEQQTGSLAPKPARGGPERLLSADDQAWLVAYVGKHADATLAEVGAAWLAYSGRPMGQTCLWNVLNEHQLRRKKKSVRHGT
jgi:putative transposase